MKRPSDWGRKYEKRRTTEMPFQMEIVDGVLRLTVPVSKVICGLCGTAYDRVIAKQTNADTFVFSQPLTTFIKIPEWEKWRWIGGVNRGKIEETLICPTCSLPLREAEKVGEERKRAVVESLAAIIEKKNLRGDRP